MSNRSAQARLLIDPPLPGSTNMALDHALLESVSASGDVVLRFYQWSEPTLSLGYFQRLAARTEHPASRHAVVVRRASGGGAILHDRELTYSLVVPADFSVAATTGETGPRALYHAMHQSLIAALSGIGVAANLCDCPLPAPSGSQPFMCFARHCDGDVLIQHHKVAGSAQRKHRGAVLQHGSVLLDASPLAPELLGISQLASTAISPELLGQLWLPHLTASLGLAFRQSPWTAAERGRSLELQQGRYATVEWTSLK
jgi:lipoate-protein ligase A